MIKAGDSLYLTNNIKLACALVTMGHKFKDCESCVIEENGKSEVQFVFDDAGGLVSKDAVKWKGGLEKMNLEEPLAYLWAYAHKVLLDFSRPGKPTDNAFIESFNSRFRQECLNEHWFLSIEDARVKIVGWWREYNSHRPHSSLGYMTPEEFANLEAIFTC